MFYSFWLVPSSLLSPYRPKKTPPGQKSWNVFKGKEEGNLGVKHRGRVYRADICHELCQDRGRLWKQELVVLLQAWACPAEMGGQKPPLIPTVPEGSVGYHWLQGLGREGRTFCCVMVRALKSCRSDTRPWGPDLGVTERSSGYLEIPWQQHLYLKSWWLRILQALSCSRGQWYEGSAAEEEHRREGG